MDVESLERENDRGLDALSERIGLLKQVCHLQQAVAAKHACVVCVTCLLGEQRLPCCLHVAPEPAPRVLQLCI